MRGGRRRQSERVHAAWRQARLALGGDPVSGDDFGSRPNLRSPRPPAPGPTVAARGPGVTVLTIGGAATRLRMSRPELEAMIARGALETLPIEFEHVDPTREAERLLAAV